MYNYRLMIQYDGGRYKGWQRLGQGENTVQGKIEDVLSEMAGKRIEIIGSSRTDAGVHAYAQVANFKIDRKIDPYEMMDYLNRYLPHDISIQEVVSVPDDFHARYHAKEKIYLYKIWNRGPSNPFMRKYSMHVDKKLNIERMKLASRYFIGEHDFTSFSNAKSKKKTMIRTIYSIDIEKSEGFIYIRVSGNGFLYNMVRRIVGTLIQAGLGAIDPEKIPGIISSQQRNHAGIMAEACGLFLEEIRF